MVVHATTNSLIRFIPHISPAEVISPRAAVVQGQVRTGSSMVDSIRMRPQDDEATSSSHRHRALATHSSNPYGGVGLPHGSDQGLNRVKQRQLQRHDDSLPDVSKSRDLPFASPAEQVALPSADQPSTGQGAGWSFSHGYMSAESKRMSSQ